MTAPLKIGTDARGKTFALPLDFVTQTAAILARKRVGKTYTASVIAEEFCEAGLPFVVLDPTGAWWGLRSSLDGKRDGYPVVIIGGAHGDVPLEPTAGKVIADLVIDRPGFYVIDLSQTASNAEQDRFAEEFGERLYRAKEKHRFPMHLIVDEADAFAPQQAFPQQRRMLGAFEAIVRRGGIRGIGCTLITQRPASLNKGVLTQCEMLVVLQITGPQDQDAIDDWVKRNGTKEQRDTMMASLASLQRGEAWVWSPSWLQCFEKINVRLRRTWNSSETPKAGETRLVPTKLAEVDIAKLGEQISATVARQKENDPAALKAKIRELEAALKKAPTEAKIETKWRDRPIVSEADMFQLAKVAGDFDSAQRGFTAMLGQIMERLMAFQATVPQPAVAKTFHTSPAYRAAVRALPTSPTAAAIGGGGCDIGSGGKRRILIALAQYPDGMGSRRLSLLTGISASGGTWRTYLGELRSASYVDGGGEHMVITALGRAALGSYEPLPTGSALRDYWRQRLGDSGKRRIFDVVVAAFPRALSYDEVSRETGIDTNGGTWRTYLGELRGLELIEGRGDLKACDDLFD